MELTTVADSRQSTVRVACTIIVPLKSSTDACTELSRQRLHVQRGRVGRQSSPNHHCGSAPLCMTLHLAADLGSCKLLQPKEHVSC